MWYLLMFPVVGFGAHVPPSEQAMQGICISNLGSKPLGLKFIKSTSLVKDFIFPVVSAPRMSTGKCKKSRILQLCSPTDMLMLLRMPQCTETDDTMKDFWCQKKLGMSLPGQEKTGVIQTSWYGKVLTASRLVLKTHPYSLTF